MTKQQGMEYCANAMLAKFAREKKEATNDVVEKAVWAKVERYFGQAGVQRIVLL
jgi:hypothetical protein